MKKKNEDKVILSATEMADALSISVSQVRRLIKSAGLPYIQLMKRGRLYFNRGVVLAWLKKHRKEVTT